MKKFYQNINKKLDKFLNTHSVEELAEIFAELYKNHSQGLTIDEYLNRTDHFYSEVYEIEVSSESVYLSEMPLVDDQQELEFYKNGEDISIEFSDNIEISGEAIEIEAENNFYSPYNEPDYNLAA